jgi:23S rRNA G2445 N2-methylase RlmL
VIAIEIDAAQAAALERNLGTAWSAFRAAGLETPEFSVRTEDVRSTADVGGRALLPLNPPFGERLASGGPELYGDLGRWLRRRFEPGSRGFILSPSSAAERAFASALVPRRSGSSKALHGGARVRTLFFITG